MTPPATSSSSSSSPIEITRLSGVQGVSVYKVVAGPHGTLSSYITQCCKADEKAGDWHALYTQFQRDHVLGTLPYRWKDYQEATLVKATFEEAIDIVVVHGALFYDGTVNDQKKADVIKRTLGLDPEQPLMTMLGKLRQVALIQETETEWELILPHDLLLQGLLPFSEVCVAHFQRHPAMPVTRQWRLQGDSSWHKWCDQELPPAIPDLEMHWLKQYTPQVPWPKPSKDGIT